MQLSTVYLGGGCFWCIESLFLCIKGVESVESGYAGGFVKYPSYKEVCSGDTGHAEVIKIVFDEETLPFKTLLNLFFDAHDPSTRNRQGADIGTQYRSIIVAFTEEQKEQAEAMIAELNSTVMKHTPVVTEVKLGDIFYAAEEYHQDYFAKNPVNPYCSALIGPKVKKWKQKYAELCKYS